MTSNIQEVILMCDNAGPTSHPLHRHAGFPWHGFLALSQARLEVGSPCHRFLNHLEVVLRVWLFCVGQKARGIIRGPSRDPIIRSLESRVTGDWEHSKLRSLEYGEMRIRIMPPPWSPIENYHRRGRLQYTDRD